MPKNDEDDEDTTTLTGAELYHHLITANESRRVDIQSKLSTYRSTQETLTTLLERTKFQVLAPVAGGLAYFDADLIHTNEVLVLLGDNWFANRSVKQAVGIVERRLGFLRREAKVVEEESKHLAARREFFVEEFPSGSEAMKQCEGNTGKAPSPQKSALPPPTSSPQPPPQQQQPTVNRPQELLPGKSELRVPEVGATLEEEEEAVDVQDGELLFVAEDELTVSELEALEAHMTPGQLEDDEYVEKICLDLMMQKRAKRLSDQREAMRRAAFPNNEPSEVPSPSAVFRSPADIGVAYPSGSPNAPTQVMQTTVKQDDLEHNPRAPITTSQHLAGSDLTEKSALKVEERDRRASKHVSFAENNADDSAIVSAQSSAKVAMGDFTQRALQGSRHCDVFGGNNELEGLPALHKDEAGDIIDVRKLMGRPIFAQSAAPLGEVVERVTSRDAAKNDARRGANTSSGRSSLFMKRQGGVE